MTHTLVVPNDEALLSRLRGRRVVLRLDRADELAAAARAGERHGLDVEWIWVTVPGAVTSVGLEHDLGGARLALWAERLGALREALRRVPRLRELSARVYLPATPAANLVSIRLLASLGVECAVVMGPRSDWDALTDLATYALLEVVPHAPVEPFAYLAREYQAARRTDFSDVYFDDPRRFLHLDRAGRVALSGGDAAAGRFVVDDPGQTDGVDALPAFQDRLASWTRFFERPHRCASCPGFRVCIGRFDAIGEPGCSGLFAETLDLIEGLRARRAGRSAA